MKSYVNFIARNVQKSYCWKKAECFFSVFFENNRLMSRDCLTILSGSEFQISGHEPARTGLTVYSKLT